MLQNYAIEMEDVLDIYEGTEEVWEEVEMIAGSGASGTLVGESMVKAVEATHVKNYVPFKLADGSRTPHMGSNRHSLYGPRTHSSHGGSGDGSGRCTA